MVFSTILGKNPFFGIDYLLHLPEKYYLLHLQISKEEMTIVCGF